MDLDVGSACDDSPVGEHEPNWLVLASWMAALHDPGEADSSCCVGVGFGASRLASLGGERLFVYLFRFLVWGLHSYQPPLAV